MKYSTAILCLLITLAPFAGCRQPGTAPQQTAQSDGKPANADTESANYGDLHLNKLQAEFDLLVTSIQLSEEQKSDLEEWHRESMNQARNWFDENGPAIAKIQGKAISAAKKKNLNSLNKMKRSGDKETVTRLVNLQRDMLTKHRSELEKRIPAEQKVTWQSKLITKKLLDFVEPLELSDQQIQQLDDLAPQAIAKLKADQQENWRGYGTTNLEKLFEGQVVTQLQKAPFADLKKRNRMRMLKWGDRF